VTRREHAWCVLASPAYAALERNAAG